MKGINPCGLLQLKLRLRFLLHIPTPGAAAWEEAQGEVQLYFYLRTHMLCESLKSSAEPFAASIPERLCLRGNNGARVSQAIHLIQEVIPSVIIWVQMEIIKA